MTKINLIGKYLSNTYSEIPAVVELYNFTFEKFDWENPFVTQQEYLDLMKKEFEKHLIEYFKFDKNNE